MTRATNKAIAEELIREQTTCGQKIQEIVKQFKAQQPQQRTIAGIKDSLQQLEENWAQFESTDTQIRSVPSPPRDHQYFIEEYYAKVQEVYIQYRERIIQELRRLEKEGTRGQQVQPGQDDQQEWFFSPSTPQNNPTNISKGRSQPQDAKEKERNNGITSVQGQIPSERGMELIRLQRRHMSITESVRKLIQGINENIDSYRQQHCELKSQILSKQWEQVEDSKHTLFELSDHPELVEDYDDLETMVHDTLILLSTKSSEASKPSMLVEVPNQRQANCQIELPKITLPKFDGDYLRWPQFYDLFYQMVHTQSMSNSQKMWYLKTNLTGEPEKLLRHFGISEENYRDAWEMLKNRYNNPRLQVAAMVNKMLAQPNQSQEGASAATIKALHDTTQECLRGLENLKVDTKSWDPLLLHILVRKLDRTTHMLYEQSLENPKELQTMKDFLKFLELRFQALEVLGTKIKMDTPKRQVVRALTSTTWNMSQQVPPCVLCKIKHPLFGCRSFLQMTPEARIKVLQKNNLCMNCLKAGCNINRCSSRGCTKCTRKHNSLIHIQGHKGYNNDKVSVVNELEVARQKPPKREEKISSKTDGWSDEKEAVALSTTAENTKLQKYVILGTARINLKGPGGKMVQCRAVLDSGSQVNLVTSKIVRKLGIKGMVDSLSIHGVGQRTQKSRSRVNVWMESLTSGFSMHIEAFVLPQITSTQPGKKIDTTKWNLPRGIKLADPMFNTPQQVDVLLGAEIFYELIIEGQMRINQELPLLQNTKLGWVVAGKVGEARSPDAVCGICTSEIDLEQAIEKFWKLEDMDTGHDSKTKAQEKECERHFNITTKRNQEGRFIVKLPFVAEPGKLGDSCKLAYMRLHSMERKLAKDPNLRTQYVNFMREYLQQRHMEPVDIRTIKPPMYFLPHHCVLNPESSSTKLRVVFDASAKTTTDLSLNDILDGGETVQDDLATILYRFRMNQFVFTADIEKMYRQILMHEEDRKYQLILWREVPEEPIKCYQLRTVTYGTRSAPYLATRVIKKLADDNEKSQPLAAAILKKECYVDNIFTGSNSINEAVQMQKQVIQLLKEGGFELRKWCANHERLLREIPLEHQEIQVNFESGEEQHIKTLGLIWKPKSDQFAVKINHDTSVTRLTKRKIASQIARLFDPLGIMSPVVITAKIFLQELWQEKLEWDTNVPEEIEHRWLKFYEKLPQLDKINVDRYVLQYPNPKKIQLHVFADASEKAYGAVAYIRTKNKNNQVTVRLLCSKSRVAPVKKVTLPRLELCAAVLAAELAKKIEAAVEQEEITTHFWTDSEIVLAWINSKSAAFHTFVANRVSTINKLTATAQWRHVSSKDNPADALSRGISPDKLQLCNLWFYGPFFLHGNEGVWPQEYKQKEECSLERKRKAVSLAITQDGEWILNINHGNSFRRLQRIISYVRRFIMYTRRKQQRYPDETITTNEMYEARYIIVRAIQQREFVQERKQLEINAEVEKGSAVSNLAPFIDDRGLIRVGGRLEASSLPYDAKHQMLLPYAHPLTKLIMETLHKENSHVGPQGLLALTRQHYWPLKAKTIARSVVHNCTTCVKANPKTFTQLMGNLPRNRIEPARPFVNSGVDFCGPVWVHYHTRGKKPQKAYVAVFCCFATKAIHLELVSDLTTDAFIGALKRFIGRRGRCKELYCDNATNFVGARNQLRELDYAIHSAKAKQCIQDTCTSKGINFNFIPPRSPHFGGLWEAAVKSAKHLLVRNVQGANLSYEELETVLIEVEAILNSRPITPMSADPNDLTALTPGHFLIGEPLTSTIDPHTLPRNTKLLTRWKLVTHLKEEFWRRWTTEYLNQLQHRYKWKQRSQNPQPGMMVIIKEDSTPVLRWPLGKIIATYEGKDGCVRVADVQTTGGISRRPIHKLAPLPSQNDTEEEQPNQSEQEQAKRRRIGPSMLTTIGIILLTLPLICANPINSTSPSITPFKEGPGIYFDDVGDIVLQTTEWNLLVYYNLDPYWMDMITLKNGSRALQHLCNQIILKSTCTQTIVHFQHLLEELEEDNKLLGNTKGNGRSRRSPLDVVGQAANWLFGVLDQNYAHQMEDTIRSVRNDEGHLLALLKNQTSLIDSTTNIIRKDNMAIEEKFHAMDNQFTQVFNRLNKQTQQTQLTRIFNAIASQLTLTAINMQRIQGAIIQAVTYSNHGQISPLLLTPTQLKEEVRKIKNHLPPSVQLPMDSTNPVQLYKVLTCEAQVTDKLVLFHLKLPLISRERFKLFKLIPIPLIVSGRLMQIVTTTSYLAIDTHRDRYYPMEEAEQATCAQLTGVVLICKQHQPIYHKESTTSSCEVALFLESKISNTCRLQATPTETTWTQLAHTNDWIYAVQEEATANIICNGRIQHVVLRGTGIIRIPPKCILKHKTVTIHGHQVYETTGRTSYTRWGNISNVESSAIHQGEMHVNNGTAFHPHAQEMKNLMETIKEEIKTENEVNIGAPTQSQITHHLSISYAGIILATIIIAFLVYKAKHRKTTLRSEPTLVKAADLDFKVQV